MLRLFSLLFLVFLFLKCGNAPQATEATTPPVEKKEITDDLVMRLSMEMIATPKTQAEIDQNLILNYAIDNNLAVQRTQKGLYFLIVKEGEGELLKWGDKISANYTGQFLNGKVFDSTQKRGEPMTFYIGNMIDGWNEGLQLLRPNGKAIFLIPSHLAYGKEGIKDKKEREIVPANAVLRFDIEVVESTK